jgi:hypothetical protein
MKPNSLIAFTILTMIFISVSCCTTQPDKQAVTEISKDSLVKRGEYLVPGKRKAFAWCKTAGIAKPYVELIQLFSYSRFSNFRLIQINSYKG